ncbi:MAG: OmpA family protein [Cyclobacteriaceae bacterium]|nr:OmpA family protein [Cyclobacteriaceae bacterium]
MKRLVLVVVVIAAPFFALAQTVQWASKVIEFSSELTPVQYSAEQALGKPNVLPAGGQNPNAWTPDKPKRSEFIKLGYANPMQIRQIAVAESYNPGSLFRVYLYDEAGKEYLVHSFNPQPVPLQGRMMNIVVDKTPYKVTAVKLMFEGEVLSDYFSIDAVAISDSDIRIIPDIDTPELLAKGLEIERLDEKVNSPSSELNPLLSPDGKTLYFSRKNHEGNVGGVNDKEDIWYSELGSDGKWQLAENMGPKFNNAGPNFVNYIGTATPDGKSVLMLVGNRYLDNGKMLAGVSMADNVGGNWSEPKALEIENDYNFNERANYFMTNTRKALLMSVEREDSRGSRDLYVSFPKEGGKWTEPLNLGAVINTAGEESAPFLASDDKTLYFSSTGFSGFGMADIFVSTRLDDTWTNWSPPENLGSEVNSKLDDLFFNIPSNSDYAYYSRGMDPENLDIFRVKLPLFKVPEPVIVVKGKLVDAKTGEPVGAKIVYERLSDGKVVGETFSDPRTGEYEIHLPGGELYGFRAEEKNHISSSQSLDLRDYKSDATITGKDVTLEPIQVAAVDTNVTITLNNIFFDFDKATLRKESFVELDRIVSLMNERPTMQVEISGHADATGPEDYNLQLSGRRARSVSAYLAKKGIAQDRITTTFFGETKPVDSNSTVEGRRKNRRVEFKIVKL